MQQPAPTYAFVSSDTDDARKAAARLTAIYGQHSVTDADVVVALGGDGFLLQTLRETGLVRCSHPQKVGDLLRGGVPLASEFLQVRIGGDVALLQGIAKELLEEEARAPGPP